MENISIDIETYSGNDLNKCGVYKYVQHPDFDVLLFGYSVDGGEVRVVDLAAGEEIPEEILAALSDEDVTKWAFNSNFERICLSEWLRRNRPEHFFSYSVEGDTVGDYLDPRGWKCSMIWSAYMGLPLSLAGVGAVLGLEEQKLKEGKELIRYFCVPCKATKSNGGRTRNLPEHDPEKWDLFKSYNKRDVEVEMSIQKRLAGYPVPDFVWDEYHLDQEINDRGIQLDMPLVESAIRIDAKIRGKLIRAQQSAASKQEQQHAQYKVVVLHALVAFRQKKGYDGRNTGCNQCTAENIAQGLNLYFRHKQQQSSQQNGNQRQCDLHGDAALIRLICFFFAHIALPPCHKPASIRFFCSDSGIFIPRLLLF